MKIKFFLPVLLLVLLLAAPAMAQEAMDITASCTVEATASSNKAARLTDRKYATAWTSNKQKAPAITITAGSEGAYGMYICFGDKTAPWQLQVQQDGKWVAVHEDNGIYAHVYVPLNGVKKFRITPTTDKQTTLCVSEIYVLGAGDVPAWVQQWQPAPQKADLMLLAAHPDDELLFFGGAIPYYAGELKKDVVVAYMTYATFERRSELLDGLWACGLTTYPEIGTFYDGYSSNLSGGYDKWGKKNVTTYITGILRKYQPDVVVTHDINGEYGHGAHRVCADALQICVGYAADSTRYPDQVSLYGTWQVKKLYLHLAKEGAIHMDWRLPLEAFDGQSGFDVAAEAYKHHLSQQDKGQKSKVTGKFEVFVVEPEDSLYSCFDFGLVHTTVGNDVLKNDFLENVE